MFEEAIEEGTWTGITIGMLDSGILINDAADIMRRIRFTGHPHLNSCKERGIFKALKKNNLVYKRGFWWGDWSLSETGLQWLENPVCGKAEKIIQETVRKTLDDWNIKG